MHLFCSIARNEAVPDCDVDLFFDPASSRFNVLGDMAVRDAVEALLGCKADMMTRGSLHPYLHARIEAEVLRIF